MLSSVVRFSTRSSCVAIALACVAVLSGCAAYHPRPITPSETMRTLRSRSLGSPGLREFVESELDSPLPNWPPEQWDLPLLTLAGLYFHPDLDVARSLVSLADARVVTAGTLPNPTFAFTFRYNTDAARKPGNNLARVVRRGARDGALQGLDDATGGTLGLPVAAIADRDGTPVVTVIRDNKAHETEVALGVQTRERVQVTKGLSPGDLVAVQGGYGLPEGCPCSVMVESGAISQPPASTQAAGG